MAKASSPKARMNTAPTTSSKVKPRDWRNLRGDGDVSIIRYRYSLGCAAECNIESERSGRGLHHAAGMKIKSGVLAECRRGRSGRQRNGSANLAPARSGGATRIAPDLIIGVCFA